MKKLVVLIVLVFVTAIAKAQVGIGTTMPKAVLDIPATNNATPTNTDGILIPRINAFPATNPTIDQNGMMVFLTVDLSGKPKGFYYWDDLTASWIGVGGGKGWEINGNTGTDSNTNFIGTTDNQDVVFKRFNLKGGRIGYFNTAFGLRALLANNSGINNSAIGTDALSSNLAGSNNTGLGSETLKINQTGSGNTAIGTQTLNSNISGNSNTAIGYQSGSNTTGSQNITIGAFANVPNPVADNQMSIGNAIYGTNMSVASTSLIGINETVPKAKLDIQASDSGAPLSSDGILIPRVYNLAAPASMTADKNGLLVFLTSGVNPGFYYWDQPSNAWKGVGKGTSGGWELTGNAGTDPTVNFIGTTDDVDVVFHRDFLEAGRLANDNTSFGRGSLRYNTGIGNAAFGNGAMGGFISGFNSGGSNTAVGSSALGHNTSGFNNSAVGRQALSSNLTGSSNSAFGRNALNSNTSASKNVALGEWALTSQDFANAGTPFDTNNVAVGVEALYNNKPTSTTDGINNVAVGNKALFGNSTGSHNVAIGYQALNGSALPINNTGSYNTAIGYQTLLNNKDGDDNVAIGSSALTTNSSGTHNVAIGVRALQLNTTGVNNTAIGWEALLNNKTGIDNFGLGIGALRANDTGARNTSIGTGSMGANVNGSNNIAMGYASLSNNISGNSNTVLGDQAMTSAKNVSNATAIGFHAMLYANNSAAASTSYNTALGYESMVGEASGLVNPGNYNTAVGYQTLSAYNSGNSNAAFGYQAIKDITSGSGNIGVGNNTLAANTTGSNNIAVGTNAQVPVINNNNQLSIANVIYGANMDNPTTAPANISIGVLPDIKYKLYSYNRQIAATGDGQYGVYSYRTRDIQNNGTGYGIGATNSAMTGYNYFGDDYSFGNIGYCYNDSFRTGGILGSYFNGSYWSSLGYKNSAGFGYGVYATAALTTGTGRMAPPSSQANIGGGFYGGIIGSWSKGEIGSVNSGSLFASYNSGDEYTAGKQIEIVDTGNQKTAAYTVTSTEVVVYKKGKITLVNGSAHVVFDINYSALLGDNPIVTTTPMGQCNGIYIESVDKTGFTIQELNNGSSNVSVSWIAVGDRIDANSHIQAAVLDKNFDANINDVMFNENDKENSAQGIWSQNGEIQFGKLPASLIQKEVKLAD